MSHTVKQRLLHGFGAQLFARAATTLTQIISVPLLIHYWGVGLYGEWLILSAVPAYFAMSDVGFGGVAGNEMAMRAADGDHRGALEVLQSVWLLITTVSVLVIGAGIVVIWNVPLADWLNFQQMRDGEAAATLTWLLLMVGVSMQAGMMSAGFRAEKLYPQETLLSNVLLLANFGVFAAAIALGAGPSSGALVSLLVRVLGTLAMWYYLLRVAPWIRPGFDHARWGTIRRLFGPAIAMLAFPIGNAFTMQGTVLLVGRLLGPVAVVGLSTVRTVMNSVRQVMGIVNATVWPEVSIAFGAKDLRLARELHRRACQVSLWVALSMAVPLFLFGPQIVTVWTDGKVAVDVTFMRAMLLVVVANSFWFTSSVVPAAINRHQKMALVFLVSSALSLGAAALLLPHIGLTGVAVSLLLVDVAMIAHVLHSSLSLLNDRFRPFLHSLFSPAGLRSVLTSYFLRARQV